ncbi:MAG: Flp pilus assembly complex ATPase component TadA [Myxococcales bacterium]|nr:Flp pilus assembly complex ATPase component TadA [Myxococcales bacterium]
MFAITISEKGGAERREGFDKPEINIGRVQGNDLMLPKGNVSKHHARLLFRDGRFIVTDLKSTNGTYVNGRKIAQATIVREGDKIYIGDFVLRIESAAAAPAPAPAPQQPEAPTPGGAFQPGPYDGDELETAARENRNSAPRPPAQPVPSVRPPPIPPQPAAVAAPPPMAPMPAPAGSGRTGANPPISVPGRSGPPPIVAPAPVPVPVPAPIERPAPVQVTAAMPQTPMQQAPMPQPAMQQAPMQQPMQAGGIPTPMQMAPPMQAAMPAPMPTPSPAMPPAAAAPQPAAGVPGPRNTPSRVPPRESPQAAARRLALLTLVDRVADATDLSALGQSARVDDAVAQRIERTVRDQAGAMRSEGEVPEGIDVEQLVRDASRELIGLGPVGSLLDDDDVTEIHCIRHDHVFLSRGGVLQPAEVSFTSEEALGRVIARLAHQSGEPLRAGETTAERRVGRAHMVAMLPPASSGHALLIRKRRRQDSSLEEFVRLGAASRAMATFLENCIAARANILVCGPHRASLSASLSALAMASGGGERVVFVQDVEDCNVPHAYTLSVALADGGARGEAAVRSAARLLPERLFVSPMAGPVAVATLDVIAEGAEGVIAAAVAPSLRHALARLVAQMASARPGGVEAAREAVGESFDVAVELVTLPDGRSRVVRVAELTGSDAKGVVARDVFTSTEDGSFAATGVVPRAVADFASRGVKVDPNLFKRAVGR